jgi:hypothetical protein
MTSDPPRVSRSVRAIAFLVFLLLSLLAVAGGCARRKVTTRYRYTVVGSINVRGHIRWKGHAPPTPLDVSATPIPSSPAGVGAYVLGLAVAPDQDGAVGVAYDLGPQEMTTRARITREEARRHLPTGRAIAGETFTVQYYLVRVIPPSGWVVSPPYQKVSSDSDHIDFELRREHTSPR